MIIVKASKHPLRDEWVTAHVEGNQTIRQIVGDVAVNAWIDGYEVPAWLIENGRIKSGTHVTVRPVPQGGDIFRSIAQIAVVAFAAAVSGGAIFGLTGFAATAAGMGIALAGGLLINALIPPTTPTTSGRSTDSFNRLEALTGSSNRVAAFQPFPRVYGRMRFFPPIPMTARPYTELKGNSQYLRMMLCLGYGPLEIGGKQVGAGQGVLDENTPLTGIPIQIDDTDIHALDDVEFEIGRPEQMTLYTDQIIETNPGFVTNTDVSGIDTDEHPRWVNDGDSAIRTTDTDATEISIDVAGQMFCVSEDGKTSTVKVDWKIEYRPVGGSTWTVVANPWTISSTKKETVRRGYRWKVSKGQYEVRLTRIRTWFRHFEATSQEMTWSSLRTIRGGKRAFDVDGQVVMALRIRASDQLNGRVETLSVQATSVLNVWNGSKWSLQATRTPAWIYADILTGAANRRPLALSDLNANELLAWAQQTNADEDYYDAVLDSPATVLEKMREVTAIGRATWSIDSDTSVSVIRDTEQTNPKMVISPRNSYNFAYELSATEIPHALRVRFVDSTTWENTERLVFDDGYTESNATIYEVLEAPGITNAKQAWRFGRYHLAQQRLRPERYFFNQDVQHLRYQRGDMLTLHHDIILTGIAAGRVKSVTLDGNGDTIAFVSDQFLYMPSIAQDFGIKAQLSDGSIVVAGVQNDAPGNTEITLNSPVTGLAADDHFIYGVVGSESIDVKVSAIEPQGNFVARITCVPAAPNILDALTGEIPVFNPVITAPINPDKLPLPVPTIDRIVSDESVLVPDGDGSVRIRMVVESSVRGFPGWDQSRQVRYREFESDEWILLPPTPEDSYSIFQVSEGVEYAVQVRSVGVNGRASAWSPELPALHTVVGKTSPPSDVQNFHTTAARDRVQLSWDQVPDLDLDHYEIREGTVWESAEFLTVTGGTAYQTPGPSNGPWLIKAIDTSGNESINASSTSLGDIDLPYVINVSSQVVDNNVLLRWDSFAGTFDLRTHEIRRGEDVNTASVIGTSDKTFDVIFETVSGEFTYWVVPVDAAGNEGASESVTAAVDEPPAFVLRNKFQTDFQGFVSTNIQPIQSAPRPSRLSTYDFTAPEFDGVDDYILIANTLPGNSAAASTGTIEALGICDDINSRGIIYEEGNETDGINIYVDGGNVYVGWWSDTNSGTQRFLSAPIARGKRFHVAATFDATANAFKGYLDGTEFDSQTIGSVSLAAHDDTNSIGANTDNTRFHDGNDTAGPNNFYKGFIGEVRRWSDVRTPTEINDWKDRTLHGDEAGLEAYWRLKDGSGDTAGDKSGNGHSGAIAGTVWHTPQVRALIPYPVNVTPNTRIGEGYASPQDLIDAGHIYPGLPAPTSATFEEIFDAGTVIPSTRINATLAGTTVVGTVNAVVQLSIKEDINDAWTDYAPGLQQIFATNFRYVKVKVTYSGDGNSFRDSQDINVVLSTKQKTDAGNVNVTSNPTSVTFNVDFIDVDSITLTPQGTTALTAVADFVDAPNPTGFDIYLFTADTGVATTGVVRWQAGGV